jgi:hypothetical protein
MSAAEADLITDLVHKTENLKEPGAKAPSLNLKRPTRRSTFEIGGVLSAMQKEKWYDPSPRSRKWVENETAMKRSKARALIQIYKASVAFGIRWAQINQIGWTKLRAIAGVLNKENADNWIEVASKQSKSGVINASAILENWPQDLHFRPGEGQNSSTHSSRHR